MKQHFSGCSFPMSDELALKHAFDTSLIFSLSRTVEDESGKSDVLSNNYICEIYVITFVSS